MAKDDTQMHSIGRAGIHIIPEEEVKVLFSGPGATGAQFTKFMLDKPEAATPRPTPREGFKPD